MKLAFALTLLASLHAAVVDGFTVVWPEGYTPTRSDHDHAAAQAEALAARGPEAAGGANAPATLDRRDGSGSAVGCVQVHCYADHNTEINLRDYTQMTVWRDGQLILYLVAAKEVTDRSDHIEWAGALDHANVHWGFRTWTHCSKIAYISSSQSTYDWRYLTNVGSHSFVEKGGGYCPRAGKDGNLKCVDATFWEAVYTDPAACNGRGNPALCDFKQYCVGVNNVPQCNRDGFCA